jgi:group II intron reverse transcriptase/maturase
MDEKVSRLRETLYLSAKADTERRFHALYDRIYRKDVLLEAWNAVRKNGGTAGIDNVHIRDIENSDTDAFIEGIHQELKQHAYRPLPVRRVLIPKSNGKMRALGIPAIRDRVVQTAVKLVIEPIFETDFEDCSYGFRPNKSAHDAVDAVVKYLNFGCEQVIDADISGCFDNIPKHPLMMSVARRIVDGSTLALIRSFLDAGIMDGSELSEPVAGTPQGSPLSPLLANIYLDHLDKRWKNAAHTTATHLVRYADDYLILGKGNMESELRFLRTVMEEMQLSLNEEKTRLVTAEEGFDFLGFHFIRHYSRRKGKRVTRWFPSPKSKQKIRSRIKEMTAKQRLSSMTPYEAKAELERTLTGWYGYFRHSMCSPAFSQVRESAQQSIGRMYNRWKQRKYIGRQKDMERHHLLLRSPPSPRTYTYLAHDAG